MRSWWWLLRGKLACFGDCQPHLLGDRLQLTRVQISLTSTPCIWRRASNNNLLSSAALLETLSLVHLLATGSFLFIPRPWYLQRLLHL